MLPDDLFPNRRMIVSADVTARYDCLPQLPKTNDFATIFSALFPVPCASQYRFYALDVDEARNVPAVQREILRRADALNAALPSALTEQGISYQPIMTTRGDERARVEHAIRPGIVALTLFGLLAATATVVVCALFALRIIGQSRDTLILLRALGMSRAHRVLAVSAPVAGATAVGIAGAVALGYAASGLAPAGVVRAVDPHPALSLPAGVVFPVVLTIAVLLAGAFVAGAFVVAGRAGRASRGRDNGPGIWSARSERRFAPPFTEGLRSVVGDRRAGPVLLIGSSCVAIAALVTAVVFATSLSGLVDRSERYGWPWDFAVLTNFGYGNTDIEAVDATLRHRTDIASWSFAAFGRNATIVDASVPLVLSEAGPRALRLPVVDRSRAATRGRAGARFRHRACAAR